MNPAQVHARIRRLQCAEFHAQFARDAHRCFARDDRVRARRGGGWFRSCGTACVRAGGRGGNSLPRLDRDWIRDRLRRGILIIEGDAGDDLGSRFIAGTIIALGKTPGRVGYLNKRGSIVLAKRPDLPPTYVDCGPQNLTFAKLYARGLKADSAGAAAVLSGRLRRFGGDTSVYGKGEILTPA